MTIIDETTQDGGSTAVRAVEQAGHDRWQRQFRAADDAGRVRDADFTTLSGLEVEPV